MAEDDDLDLSSLDDEELVKQMQDDLYDGLKEEIGGRCQYSAKPWLGTL